MSTAVSHQLATQLLLGGVRKRRTTRAKPRKTVSSAPRRRMKGGIHPAILGLLTHVIAPVISHNLNRIPFVKKIREKIGIGKRRKHMLPRTPRVRRTTGSSYMLPGAPRVRRARGGVAKKKHTRRVMYRAPVLNPF